MVQEWNSFFKALRIMFWAMFMAPTWVFVSLWFLNNGNPELLNTLGLVGYFPYIIGAIILLGVLVSIWVRKKFLGQLPETMDVGGQQNLIRKALIFGCFCVETAAFTGILASHLLGQRDVMVYSAIASLFMLLHYPSESSLQHLIQGNDTGSDL
jgi:hypothetical protein